MILYKYYGYKAGLDALRNSRLGFRIPEYSNDTFELTFLSNIKGTNSKRYRLGHVVGFDALKNHIAILSLTRTPLNPLMWAHYGKEHEGFVIGYDTNDKFLTSKDYNLVTVEDGDVVYTNTKNAYTLTRASMIQLQALINWVMQGLEPKDTQRAQIESLTRKTFLTKHSSWVYEEEVRVVKASLPVEATLSDPLRRWRPLYKVVTPDNACDMVKGLRIYYYQVRIKEVYLGIRNPLLHTQEMDDRAYPPDRGLINKANEEKWKVYRLKMSPRSWDLKPIKVPIDILAVRKKSEGLINNFEFSGKEASFLKSRIPDSTVSEEDEFELTNWDGQCHLQVNRKFIEK